MTPADLPAVMELERVCFPTPWSLGTYQRELLNRHASCWVIRPTAAVADAPALLGYAGLWHLGDEAHITTIATHPGWRRRHLAEWLLVHLADVAGRRGARALTLEVRMHNTGAIALYTKLGFVSVGVRKGYYQDTGEDARLLTLFAIDHPAVWGQLAARQAEIEEGNPA
jgi:ribosomal-protein-alanine N-acetyltransferase